MINFMGRLGGFANLAGIGKRAAKTGKATAEKPQDDEDENDRPVRDDGESDEDYAKRCESYAEESDDEDMKRKDGESDSDYAKRMDALHDEPDGDEDEDGNEPEDDDNPDKDEDEEDAKKAKKAEAHGYRRGFKAANTRSAKIFGSAEAADNLQLAAQLAFNTDMTAEAAIAVMKTASVGGPGKLARRMAAVNTPRIGAGAPTEQSSEAAIQNSWAEAAKSFVPKS